MSILCELFSLKNIINLSLAKEDIAEIFWIGLNQLDVSGGWQWSDHKPLNFLNWHPGNDVSSGINSIHNTN